MVLMMPKSPPFSIPPFTSRQYLLAYCGTGRVYGTTHSTVLYGERRAKNDTGFFLGFRARGIPFPAFFSSVVGHSGWVQSAAVSLREPFHDGPRRSFPPIPGCGMLVGRRHSSLSRLGHSQTATHAFFLFRPHLFLLSTHACLGKLYADASLQFRYGILGRRLVP